MTNQHPRALARFLPRVAGLSRSSVLRVATLTRRRVSIGHYPVGGSYQCSPSISGRTFRRRMSNGGFGFSIESKQISTRRSGVPGIFHPRKRSGTFCLGKITPPGPSRGPSRARGPHARSRINILIIESLPCSMLSGLDWFAAVSNLY